jgi:hypothetical protein
MLALIIDQPMGGDRASRKRGAVTADIPEQAVGADATYVDADGVERSEDNPGDAEPTTDEDAKAPA